MRLSLHSSSVLRATPNQCIAEAQRAANAGLAGYWAPMLDGLDTLTMLAVIGSTVPSIDLGTAVVPIPLRSPYALAQQVKTIQAVTGGRLTLGLGTSHPTMVREIFGGEWSAPLPAIRAYLEAFLPLLSSDSGPVAAVHVSRPSVLLGAVNPGMARVAAELADGVVTWAAGLRTIEEVVMSAAAERTSGVPFHTVVSLPVTVTDDIDAGRAAVQRKFGSNDNLPSYQKVREREGVDGIADIALIGDERHVAEQLARYVDLGVAEFAAHIVEPVGDENRTWDFLAQQAAAAPPAVASDPTGGE